MDWEIIVHIVHIKNISQNERETSKTEPIKRISFLLADVSTPWRPSNNSELRFAQQKCYKIESNAERNERLKWAQSERSKKSRSHSARERSETRIRKRKERNERKLCEQLSHVVHLTHFLAFIMPRPGSGEVIKQREKARLPTLLLLLQSSCHVIKLAKWLSL